MRMPDFEVTWQMTGTMRFEATDDLTAKEAVDALDADHVVNASAVQETRVIATREVEAKK
jgi:hypothetical protein